MELPRTGASHSEVLDRLARAGEHDVRFREGRLFSLVYGVDDEHARLLADAYGMYLATNGLGRGFLFQSLGRFEEELIGGTLELVGSPDGAGDLTSGLHRSLRAAAVRYMRGVEAAGFRVLGDPLMHLFAFAPREPEVDANAVADEILARGWVVLRQPTEPPSLHLLLTPPHAAACEEFLRDLAAATEVVRASAARSGKTSSYTG